MPTNKERREISKEGTTIKEIISEWLKENGYQGLFNDDIECGCGLDSLFPCGLFSSFCAAAYEFRCYKCVHFDGCEKREGYDIFYSSNKDWCIDYEVINNANE